jgi:hypothetical protein
MNLLLFKTNNQLNSESSSSESSESSSEDSEEDSDSKDLPENDCNQIKS